MKKVTLGIICFLFSAILMAQKTYFVYLQTENQQPFFVRMNEKVFSSTASGYLILSKLIDSTYNYKIGFPGKSEDLNFSTSVNKKDHGYLLKNFGDKGWGLVDLQTLSIQMPVNEKKVADANLKLDSNANAFTELLSKAADDSTLKYITAVKEESKKKEEIKSDIIQPVIKVEIPINNDEKKSETVKADSMQKNLEVVKTDLVVENKPDFKKNDEQQLEKKDSETSKESSYKRSEVIKIGQNNVVDGVEIVYVDKQSERTDTVKIVIDQPKTIVKSEDKPEENKSQKKFLDISTDSTTNAKDQLPEKKEEKIEEKKPTIIADTVQTKTKEQSEIKDELKKLWPFNKNKEKKCDVADNNDFLKLRRKMAARTNDDGMIDEAKKYFKTKCFTTEQIKNLSSMFLSNAGKYHFFDAAYEYVADKENFASLQSELKDEYYLGRFKAMLQN